MLVGEWMEDQRWQCPTGRLLAFPPRLPDPRSRNASCFIRIWVRASSFHGSFPSTDRRTQGNTLDGLVLIPPSAGHGASDDRPLVSCAALVFFDPALRGLWRASSQRAGSPDSICARSLSVNAAAPACRSRDFSMYSASPAVARAIGKVQPRGRHGERQLSPPQCRDTPHRVSHSGIWNAGARPTGNCGVRLQLLDLDAEAQCVITGMES